MFAQEVRFTQLKGGAGLGPGIKVLEVSGELLCT